MDFHVESHHGRKPAIRQKYEIKVVGIEQSFALNIEQHTRRTNDVDTDEVHITNTSRVSFTSLYGSDPTEKLAEGIEAVVGASYIVEVNGKSISLTAKTKGAPRTLSVPEISLDAESGIDVSLRVVQEGQFASVYVKRNFKNKIHIPRTTQSSSYRVPKVGDQLLLVDSVGDRDHTFTRNVIAVERDAKCTCDILTLNEPIDRIDQTSDRHEGLGIVNVDPHQTNYRPAFEKTKVYLRNPNYWDDLRGGKVKHDFAKPIQPNMWDMKEISKKIIDDLVSKTRNPHLDNQFKFFGTHFHWTEYRELLQPIWEQFGEYLTEDLFVLTSNVNRPDYLIHIDYDHVEKDRPVVGSLTWPVYNCDENSVTIWHDVDVDGIPFYPYYDDMGKDPRRLIDGPDIGLWESDRYYFNSENFNPIILNHKEWHGVYNNSSQVEDRIILQWRFRPDLTWQEICDITKSIQIG